jgi:RNase P/RNase MRP subunit p29
MAEVGAGVGPEEAVEVGQAEVGAAGRVVVEVGQAEVGLAEVGAAVRVVVEVGQAEVAVAARVVVEVGQAEVAAARGVAAALPVAWEVLTGIIPAAPLSATTRCLPNRILFARRIASRP